VRAPVAAFLVAAAVAAPQTWPEAHPPTGRQPSRPPGYTPFRYPRSPEQLRHEETEEMLARARAAGKDFDAVIAHGPYHGTLDSIAAHRAPEWFLDAKFGMFVDWGPWSVAGWAPQAEKATYPDWYEKRLFEEFREYHEKTWGADIGPDDLIQLLDGGGFDTRALVQLARSAGMRYVVPFLKHHGGFSLWDSSFTHRDSLEWGLRRDVGREFADECRRAGLRYGAYVSLGEWNYPLVLGDGLHAMTFAGQPAGPLTPGTPFVSGKVPVPDFARDYLVPSLKELIDRTDPEMLWFDGEWEAPAATWRSLELAAYFYNRAALRGREVAVNDRFGKDTRGKPGWGDYFTSEFHVIEGFQAHPWEENRSLSHSYGYNWEEARDDKYVLSEEDALDLLLRVVANGGNLLLMVSPDGSGRVPDNQRRRLQFIGRWLAAHGEAIYGTRAAGLASQPDWGYLTRSKAGDRIYCIVRRWPEDGQLAVPIDLPVRSVSTMHSQTFASVTSRSEGVVRIRLGRTRPPEPYASVVVVTVTVR
jgi:alpha-L-fucosidase